MLMNLGIEPQIFFVTNI